MQLRRSPRLNKNTTFVQPKPIKPKNNTYVSNESEDEHSPTFSEMEQPVFERSINNDTYIGDFANGYIHGKGKSYFPNGTIYEGDFVNGYRHGKGKFTYEMSWADEIRPPTYTGDFVNNKEHGYGVYDWGTAGGERYEGEWSNGEMHGQGTHYKDNGTVRMGEFKNGVFVKSREPKVPLA